MKNSHISALRLLLIVAGDVEANPGPMFSGEIVEDRGGVFQAHVTQIEDVGAIDHHLQNLKQNSKISKATHNIVVYTIGQGSRTLAGWVNDGEHGAGHRLLQMFQNVGVNNVLVVVSRSYGGKHLGPRRFRHINACALNALQAQNMMPGVGSVDEPVKVKCNPSSLGRRPLSRVVPQTQ